MPCGIELEGLTTVVVGGGWTGLELQGGDGRTRAGGWATPGVGANNEDGRKLRVGSGQVHSGAEEVSERWRRGFRDSSGNLW